MSCLIKLIHINMFQVFLFINLVEKLKEISYSYEAKQID
jgi:hypothetical protein